MEQARLLPTGILPDGDGQFLTITPGNFTIDGPGSGIPGDFDGDTDLDMFDFSQFAACFTGPDGNPIDAPCAPADFNNDRHVDLTDYTAFHNTMTGPTP